jgi:uncharacterized repeat protein (TIGR01451 family)
VTGSSSAAPSSFAALNLTAGGKTETFVVGGATESQPDPDLGAGQPFRFPKYGARGARVNYKDATDNGKNKNANSLRQTMTVTTGDIDPIDGQVHVRFAVAPVLENPSHGYTQQPYYYVELANLTRGTKLYQDFNTAGQSGVPWKTTTSIVTNNTVQWTNWQLVDVAPGPAALAIGDQVQLTVVAAGCALGGHFGRVYVDGMGSSVPGVYSWGTGPTSAAADSDITYTLYYSNGGAAVANAARIEMAMPPNTTYQSSSGPQTCTGVAVGGTGTLSCPLGNLAPGASGSITVTVRVSASATGTITNGNYSITALNSSPLIGATISTSVIAVSGRRADIRVTTTTSANSVDWNGSFTYTTRVRNLGPDRATAAQLTFTDVFPAQLTGVSWTCARTNGNPGQTDCGVTAGTGNISTHPKLDDQGEVTYTITGTVINGSGLGSMTNTATATMSGRPDPVLGNNTTVTTTAIGLARTLTFTKTGSASGSVSSSPTGISCGLGCSMASPTFANGAQVTLVAAPIPGASFTGWGGDCSGTTTTCTLTMSANRAVSAAFAPAPAAGMATRVSTYTGSGQLARRSTAFASRLVAYVTDASGTPVSGATVTFTAVPVSGASATFTPATATSNAPRPARTRSPPR